MDLFEKPLQSRLRILTHCLIISGTLNLALITTFLMTCLFKDRVSMPSMQGNPVLKKMAPTNQEILKTFRTFSYEELVQQLYDESHLEEGQRRCDLALGSLATYHYFDVSRALSGYPVNKRALLLDDGSSVTLYTGLDRGKFEAIRTFARTEVWPFTPEGLFREIQLRKELPKSLREAFESTAEYFMIQRAFRRLPYPISEDTLFSLIVEGNWEDVERLSHQIKENPHGQMEDFVSFLMSQVEKGSKESARLLIAFEKEYALKKLTDKQVETLLALLTESGPEIRLSLPSTDLAKGVETSAPIFARRHLVQPGDNLWKISRHYAVPIEKIQEMNGLKSDCLKLGTELLLPPTQS